jgi:hypothetical protein
MKLEGKWEGRSKNADLLAVEKDCERKAGPRFWQSHDKRLLKRLQI